MKKIKHIPFQEIESIPQLIKDFLNNELNSRYGDFRFNRENFLSQMEFRNRTFSIDQRKALQQVLLKQHEKNEVSELQKENIQKIGQEGCYTVITGHQLNLFTGPLYFVYKILQTIKTSEYLKKEFPEQNFIPVFWMASEDHDFEEINHFQTKENYYEVRGFSGGPVGKIKVQDEFFIHEFEKDFADTVYGTELIRWMKEAYQQGNTLSEATRKLVQWLFASYGLLIVDGDQSELKEQMITTFEQELFENKLEEETRNEVDFLKGKYGKVQVNPREINLFYLSQTRNRIEKDKLGFRAVDTEIHWSMEQLKNELRSNPERFSPNALLRPVFQETVLPNLAYIGGNAEIMYWLELKEYFAYLNQRLPVLIPRNSLLVLSEKQCKKLHKLNLSVEDLFGNFARVTAREILENSELRILLEEKRLIVEQSFEAIMQRASETEATFSNLVAAEKKRQLKSYERMRKRLLKAERIKQSEKLDRLETLFLEVHPGGSWQERKWNFSVFYADEGKDWLQNCYQQIDVEKSGINILLI